MTAKTAKTANAAKLAGHAATIETAVAPGGASSPRNAEATEAARKREAEFIAGLLHHPDLLREPVVCTVLLINGRYFATAAGRAAARELVLSGPRPEAIAAAITKCGGGEAWKRFFAKFTKPHAREVIAWASDLIRESYQPEFSI